MFMQDYFCKAGIMPPLCFFFKNVSRVKKGFVSGVGTMEHLFLGYGYLLQI
jgi:hypothetical protein